MKKLLLLLLIFAVAAGAYYKDLVVGETAGHQVIISRGGVLSEARVNVVPDDVTPSVATGNIVVTGINTGATVITDLDNPVAGATYTIICGSIAGGFQSTIADGGNFTLADGWAPIAVGDSITLYCRADNDYVEVARKYVGADGGPQIGDPFLAGADAVGAPGHSWQGDPNTGLRNSAADVITFVVGAADIGNIDAAGADFIALDATPIGTVAPSGGTFTNLAATGNFEYGQATDEWHNNYRRTETIKFIDTFSYGATAQYAVDWNVAGVVGAGTNTVNVRPGWSELVTGGAGGPDMESTVSNGLAYTRAYEPRVEAVVEIAALGGQRFEIGLYAAANELCEIVYDTAIGANWLLQVDDTTGVETIDSGVVVAAATPTRLEFTVDAAGAVIWAIDGVEMGVVGLTNVVTANPHYLRWMETDIAAAVHTVAVDYVEVETLKQP